MIRVNGKELPWKENVSIQTLVEMQNCPYMAIAVSVNGRMVSKEAYCNTYIEDGDDIKIIYPIVGG